MKQLLRKSFALTAFAMLGASLTAQTAESLTPTTDAWVRSDNAGQKTGTQNKMEVKDYVNTDEGKDVKFYGVLTFALNKPEGYRVKSASLRLTTERIKTNRQTALYYMACDVAEGDLNYNAAIAQIATALQGQAVTFNAEGQNNKSVALDAVDAEKYQTITAWQNTIDVTALARQLLPTDQTLSILVAAANASDKNNNSNCFFTKEQADFTNAKTEALGTVGADDVVPLLTVEYEEDTDTKMDALLPTYDSTCRTTANGKYGAETTMEIKNNTDFVGLMAFTLPAELFDTDSYELQSAQLRLTFERVKGGRAMELYPYGEDFNETDGLGHTDPTNGTRQRTEAAIAAAKEAGTILTFDANGTNKALTVDEIPEAYRTIDRWQNTLDLTAHIGTLIASGEADAQTMRLMIAAAEGSTDAKKIFTKDAEDFANTRDASLAFQRDDLVPVLTLVYRKTGDDTAVQTVTISPATEGIYTLSGQRVQKAGKGLCIVNGKKVIIK